MFLEASKLASDLTEGHIDVDNTSIIFYQAEPLYQAVVIPDFVEVCVGAV